MASKSTYKANERHEFHPDTPCPFCGRGDQYEVNWIDISEGPVLGETFIPGSITCLNPECPRGVVEWIAG